MTGNITKPNRTALFQKCKPRSIVIPRRYSSSGDPDACRSDFDGDDLPWSMWPVPTMMLLSPEFAAAVFAALDAALFAYVFLKRLDARTL
jgi:hypothetical protein